KRKDTKVPQPSGPTENVTDEAVYKEMNNSLERAATTATSLDAEQDRGNINKTQSKATHSEPSSLGTSSGVNTPRSDEDILKLNELIEFCTKLQQIIVDLENTKTAQAQEITSLKLRVEKLENKGGSRTYKLKRLYKVGRSERVISSDEASLGDQEDASKQGRIDNIDVDVRINLVSTHFDADTDMFGVHDLVGDEVVVETKVASKDVNLKPEQCTITTTTAATIVTTASTRPKAKGLVIHEGDSIFDKQEAIRLQAEFDEEERLTKEKDGRPILEAQEQEELTDEEKARLFIQFLEQRRKHFAAKRAE
ncbi:hypothetical protein Tco_0077616, partial [Tanacetum coccineum]